MTLEGKRVAILRAEEQSEGPLRLLKERGAHAVAVATIAIGPPSDTARLYAALSPAALRATDWVVFTSANGVVHTWNALAKEGRGGEAFGAARFAVVGPATAEALASRGVTAHLVAKELRGEGLAAAMVPELKAGERVLLLRAKEASDVLPKALLAAGAEVDDVVAYETRACEAGTAQLTAMLREKQLDVVIFSSGSSVTAVADVIGEGSQASSLSTDVIVLCLGPVTAAAARARGIRVDVVPEVATFSAAVDALDRYFHAI